MTKGAILRGFLKKQLYRYGERLLKTSVEEVVIILIIVTRNVLIELMKNSFDAWVLVSSLKYRSSPQRCPIKKGVPKISQNLQENTCGRISFLTKLQACNFIKKDALAQEFSCEFCEIFKNTFFTEHFWVSVSVKYQSSGLHLFALLDPPLLT